MPNTQRQLSRVCLRCNCCAILMLKQIALFLFYRNPCSPSRHTLHPQSAALPALDCQMLLNQKGVGQGEAVYLTLHQLLWNFIPQTPALGLKADYTGSSPSYLSNWFVPRPCCPLPNGACLCTEGQIQSSPSLNIFK